jgi:hypothetical protein
MRILVRLLLVSCTLVTLARFAEGSQRARIAHIDGARSPNIDVYLDILDADGNVVSGRTRESFTLAIDSTRQVAASQVQTVRERRVPVDVAVVVPLVPSLEETMGELRHAVRTLADALPPTSQMALIGYGTEKKRLTDALGPPAEAAAATSAIAVDGAGVEGHLLEAVRDAITLVEAAPAGKPGAPRRKLVVVFSDGVDANMEAPAFESAANRALTAHVVIDTIGWAPYENRTLRALATLARKSRGTARTCAGPGEIVPRFDSLVAELDGEYAITFQAPEQWTDGRMHNFQVTVDGEPPIYSDEQRALLPQATQRDPDVLRRQLRLCAIVALVVLALGLLVLVVYLRRRHGDATTEPPSAEPSAPAPEAQPAASMPRKTVALAAALSHGAFPVG